VTINPTRATTQRNPTWRNMIISFMSNQKAAAGHVEKVTNECRTIWNQSA